MSKPYYVIPVTWKELVDCFMEKTLKEVPVDFAVYNLHQQFLAERTCQALADNKDQVLFNIILQKSEETGDAESKETVTEENNPESSGEEASVERS